MNFSVLISIFFVLTLEAFGQTDIPIGSWRTHFSYRQATSVAVAENKIYCTAGTGLFYFDLEDNSTNKLSKIDGLSDTEIADLAYSDDQKTLIIAYSNGNIDLLNDNLITNFNVIKSASIFESKVVRDISFNGKWAYLSTDFGLLVFDLESIEIKETYSQLGIEGVPLKVQSSAVANDSLYVATEDGILAGKLDESINLQDFRNWNRFDSIVNQANGKVLALANLDEKIVAGFENKKLFYFAGADWKEINFVLEEEILDFDVAEDQVFIVTPNKLYEMASGFEVSTIVDNLIEAPLAIDLDGQGKYWIADNTNGLVSNLEGEFNTFNPSGPFSNEVFSIKSLKDKVYALAGGYDADGDPLRSENGYYEFDQGKWINYNSMGQAGSVEIPQIKDLMDIVYDNEKDLFYLSSFGYGILTWDGNEAFSILDENTQGSLLENGNPPERNTLVSGLAINDGTLWIGNYEADNPLVSLNSDKMWNSYDFNTAASKYLQKLETDFTGNLWMVLDHERSSGGVVVFDPESEMEKFLNSQTSNGNLPANRVNDIALDEEGQMWIGTSNGIAFFPFPEDVIDRPDTRAIRPIFESRNTLLNEEVTSIAIDGGNRKWIGTTRGLWLFGPSAETLVQNFNVDNSPLISNNILDIAIEPLTGEVFIATDLGIMSYRSDATKAKATHGTVKVFPNPVTRDFSGHVGISGLADDVVVKITDISGKKISETRSNGGTATWNVMDYNGQRAATGIYLIFSATSDGQETFVGKIAVVN